LALAAVLVGGGMGLHAFWGMLGWHGLPLPLQYAASVLLVVLVTNAYNLIDGIDGLAGGIGLIASLCFGIIFMVRGEAAFAILAFALAGGLLAFLRYNFQPAKIFMGDTGSLVVGFLLSAMMLHLLEGSVAPGAQLALAAPVLVMLVMAVPLGDLIQVVITRLLNGAHPFSADRRHLHHQLLSLGLSHRHAAFVLWGATLFLLAISPLLICEETFFCYLRVGGMVGGLILLLRFTLVWGARRRVSVYRLRGVSEGE
jgi:UDP-GlcNAc:undecaprenyl-phosphate GlcNAc-1-phosphate transferase